MLLLQIFWKMGLQVAVPLLSTVLLMQIFGKMGLQVVVLLSTVLLLQIFAKMGLQVAAVLLSTVLLVQMGPQVAVVLLTTVLLVQLSRKMGPQAWLPSTVFLQIFGKMGPSSTSSAVVAADFPQSEDGPPISRSAAADASEHGPSSGTDEVGTDSREDLDEPSSDPAHAAEEVCATAASAEDGSGPLHSSATPGLDGVDSSQQQAAVRENAASSNEMEAPQLMVQAIPHPDQMEAQVSDDTLAELEAIATEARALHES